MHTVSSDAPSQLDADRNSPSLESLGKPTAPRPSQNSHLSPPPCTRRQQDPRMHGLGPSHSSRHSSVSSDPTSLSRHCTLAARLAATSWHSCDIFLRRRRRCASAPTGSGGSLVVFCLSRRRVVSRLLSSGGSTPPTNSTSGTAPPTAPSPVAAACAAWTAAYLCLTSLSLNHAAQSRSVSFTVWNLPPPSAGTHEGSTHRHLPHPMRLQRSQRHLFCTSQPTPPRSCCPASPAFARSGPSSSFIIFSSVPRTR